MVGPWVESTDCDFPRSGTGGGGTVIAVAPGGRTTIAAPLIEIVDDTGVVVLDGATTIVGRCIRLRLQRHTPGPALQEIRWEVGGPHVASYHENTSKTSVDPRPALDAETLTFHFIAGGRYYVRASATVEGPRGVRRPADVTVKILVLAPLLLELKTKTGTIELEQCIRLGSEKEAGLRFLCQAKVPKDGELQLIARVQPYEWRTHVDGSQKYASTDAEWQLYSARTGVTVSRVRGQFLSPRGRSKA